ncbi:MAG: hypothetical protein E7661_00955 [Ruminococcaceae bacterium]|nr:hypothetical protein [Oscillospiraceae bacterium]
MKKFIKKMIGKGIEFLKWLWAECKDWRTLVLLGIVSLVLSSPIWIFYALGFVFNWSWAFWVATAIWGFWWLPGAPFFAIAVSVTLAIKKIFEKVKEKKLRNAEKTEDDRDEENKEDR